MTVRFGAGAYFGMGVVTPYATTGKNSDIDFLFRAQDGTDSLSYKRTKLDPKDLSSYDEQFDQVQPGEETVEGSVQDKCTFNAMQDIFRMFNGSNPAVGLGGGSPTVYPYSFTGSDKPTKFSDPNHYQAGTTTRNWVVEMYRGSIVRSATETNADTGNLTIAIGPPTTITRADTTPGWDTNVYKRGAIVTISGAVGVAANGVYVVESATTAALTLRRSADGWQSTDVIASGTATAATVSAVYYESVFYQGINIKGLKLGFQRNDYVQRTLDLVGTTYTRGASSHSYRMSASVNPAYSANFATAAFSGSTITANAGTDPWTGLGFVVGGQITVAGATTGTNNGTYKIASFDSTNGRTMTVTTLAGAAVAFTGEAFAAGTYVVCDGMTNSAKVPGVGASHAGSLLGVWVTDYATTNPGQGATKFLTLGGTHFVCRSADLSIDEPLEDRYDIGQSSSELRLPEKKRSVKLEVEIETNDDKFLDIINRPDTKSFGASGGDYTGANTFQILGSGSTAGRSIVFSFPYLTIDGDAETRVEGIGPTTAKFTLMAMSDDVNNPAYTVVVTNGDAAYRT